jgi:hypothetical protein
MAADMVVANFLALVNQILTVYTAAANHHVAKSRLYLEVDNWRAVNEYARDWVDVGLHHRTRAIQTRAQHVVQLSTNLGVFLGNAGFRFANYAPGANGNPAAVVDRPRIRLDRKADIVRDQVTLIRDELKGLKEEIDKVSGPRVK